MGSGILFLGDIAVAERMCGLYYMKDLSGVQ